MREYEDPNKIFKEMVSSMGKMSDLNSIEESLSKKYGYGLCMEKQIRENGNQCFFHNIKLLYVKL